VIDHAYQNSPCCHTGPGTISVLDLDAPGGGSVHDWIAAHPGGAVGAMGTRAKQHAAGQQIPLDFTYGVIDKSILRAMLGEDALILTTGNMVRRVFDRVSEFSRQSGLSIPVVPAPGGEENQ